MVGTPNHLIKIDINKQTPNPKHKQHLTRAASLHSKARNPIQRQLKRKWRARWKMYKQWTWCLNFSVVWNVLLNPTSASFLLVPSYPFTFISLQLAYNCTYVCSSLAFMITHCLYTYLCLLLHVSRLFVFRLGVYTNLLYPN